MSEKEAFFTTERAVKQTLHQLQHLKKVWHEVLPTSNYRKAIGKVYILVLLLIIFKCLFCPCFEINCFL